MANKQKKKSVAESAKNLFMPLEKDPTMQQIQILKNNLISQTSYTPEARKIIDSIKFKTTTDPKLYGQYNFIENTIYINPSTLNNPTFALENMRHEVNHALDNNVRRANMITNTNSRDFYPKYIKTETPQQKRELQNFYQREFGQNAQVDQRIADIEGFAQIGAKPNVGIEASQGVRSMYDKVFTPASLPRQNFTPRYKEGVTVTPFKRTYTKQYAPPEEQQMGPQKPPQQVQPNFQNAVRGDAPAFKTGNSTWDSFVSAAKKIALEQQFPLSVILGQAALETGRTSSPGNNYFGIKGSGSAGSNSLATKEATPEGQFYDTRSNFAAYTNPEDSIRAYIDLIKNRYPDAYAKKDNPQEMVQAIKAGGYASDPYYVSKVTNTPEFKTYANYRPQVPQPPQPPKLNMPITVTSPTPQKAPMPILPMYRPPTQQQYKPMATPMPTRALAPSGSQIAPSAQLKPVAQQQQKAQPNIFQKVVGGVGKFLGF